MLDNFLTTELGEEGATNSHIGTNEVNTTLVTVSMQQQQQQQQQRKGGTIVKCDLILKLNRLIMDRDTQQRIKQFTHRSKISGDTWRAMEQPITAPSIWARTYTTARNRLIFLVMHRPQVTAGLMLAPEMPAKE